MKKVEKTTGSFRHDLSQILYDCKVKLMNRFKGLDPVNKVPEELWMQVCNTVQEAVTKIFPKRNKCKNAKSLSEEALQTAQGKKEDKDNGQRERYTKLNAEFQRVARKIRRSS